MLTESNRAEASIRWYASFEVAQQPRLPEHWICDRCSRKHALHNSAFLGPVRQLELLDASGHIQAVLVGRERYPPTVDRGEVLEVRRGNAAVCGPFRPLMSLRSRRTALDVTKPVLVENR